MNILDDNCQAQSLLDGDHIYFTTEDGEAEMLENISVSDDYDGITVVGFSHVTGDKARYDLHPTFVVSTWEA